MKEAAQSLAALNRTVTADVRTPWKQKDIAPPLVIAFGMVMLDIFAQRSPQRALAEQNHLGQTLLFYRHICRDGPVQCRERLGGLLCYYHREAA